MKLRNTQAKLTRPLPEIVRPEGMKPKYRGQRTVASRQSGPKGTSHRHHLMEVVREVKLGRRRVRRLHVYHATKGWRSVNTSEVRGGLLETLMTRAGIGG